MAITAYNQSRFGQYTIVTVTSDLSGTVFYHWYVDGAYVAATVTPQYSFLLDTGEQVRIDVNDTTDPDFDAIANAPAGYPARRSLVWTQSMSDETEYRIDQDLDGGGYSTIATIDSVAGLWQYSYLTARLVDLGVYTWRVYAVDQAGNAGASYRTIGPETVVRRPDAPDFDVTFDGATTKVTFAAAA